MKQTDDRNVEDLRLEADDHATQDRMTEEQASYLRSLGESGGPFPEEITRSQAAARIAEQRGEEERSSDRPGRGTQKTYRGRREVDER